MSKAKKNGDDSKKKLGSSLPISIRFGKTKFGSANKNSFKDNEKKEDIEFIIGSYNPNKNNFLKNTLEGRKSIKSNNIDLAGEGNDVNPTNDDMIFGDLDL